MAAFWFDFVYACAVAGNPVRICGVSTRFLGRQPGPESFVNADRELHECSGQGACGVPFRSDACPFGAQLR